MTKTDDIEKISYFCFSQLKCRRHRLVPTNIIVTIYYTKILLFTSLSVCRSLKTQMRNQKKITQKIFEKKNKQKTKFFLKFNLTVLEMVEIPNEQKSHENYKFKNET